MDRLNNWLARRLPGALFAACAALFYIPLGSRALWNSDEGRYAEIAREMIERRDWIVPHLNGVLYFEKPPFMYWLTSLSLQVLGPHPFAARFWCATFGLLTVGLVYLMGRRWKSERVGLLAGVILATSLLFFALTQFLVLDMALTFWLVLALHAAMGILMERMPERVSRYSYLLAFALAGGFLTKGLVALIFPLSVLGLAIAYSRSWVQLNKVSWKGSIVLWIVMVSPWLFLITVRHPDFLEFFLIREHFSRFLTTVHHRVAPFYFFIPVLAAAFLPWTIFLPAVLKSAFKHHATALRRDPVKAMLLFWSVVITLFYSASSSKLVAYILPVLPALALLTADRFDEVFDEFTPPGWLRHGALAWAGLLSVGVAVLKLPLFLPLFRDSGAMALRAESGVLTLMMSACIMILVGTWGMRRVSASIVGIVASQLFFFAGVGLTAPAMDPYLSNAGLSRVLSVRAGAQDRIVTYGIAYENVGQSLAYYTRRRIVVMGDPGELTMGRDRAEDSVDWFTSREESPSVILRMATGTWVVTNEEYLKELVQVGGARMWEPISREGKLLLLRKSK